MTKKELESLNPFRVPATWSEAVVHGLYVGMLASAILVVALFIVYW